MKKRTDIYEPTREDIIDLMHRMTGFNEDTIVEYFRVFKIKNPGGLKLDRITRDLETLYFIERGLKIKKLMRKSDDKK